MRKGRRGSGVTLTSRPSPHPPLSFPLSPQLTLVRKSTLKIIQRKRLVQVPGCSDTRMLSLAAYESCFLLTCPQLDSREGMRRVLFPTPFCSCSSYCEPEDLFTLDVGMDLFRRICSPGRSQTLVSESQGSLTCAEAGARCGGAAGRYGSLLGAAGLSARQAPPQDHQAPGAVNY